MIDGLKEKHRKAIINILAANARVERVVLFGSRAMGTFSTTSDVDLALFGDELTLTDQAKLAAAIDELPMAQRVDLLLYRTIDNENLKKHIKKHGKEWFRRGGESVTNEQYKTHELIEQGLLQIGDGYRAKNSELSSTGIPFARAGNINDGFLFEGADCFPAEDLSKVGEKRSRPFDSVFTSKGTVGRIAFVHEGTQEFVYSPQLCYWRSLDLEVIDPRFLNYWMNGAEFKNQIDYLKGQTDMADYVSLRDQRKMTITIPDIYFQRRTAKILGQLDDKIELNRQINQTLEEMAQAIFKSWFVDFEPVKAKMEARAKLPSPCGRGAGGEGKVRKKLPPQLLKIARDMRKNMTDAEALLWKMLRNRQVANCKFRRQHPFGNYVLDFYCHEKKLAIEVDGGHHNETKQQKHDKKRTDWLKQQGVEVLRFWNHDMLQATESVLEEIYNHLISPHPQPLSLRERGERAAMCAISGKTDAELGLLPPDQLAQLRTTAALFPDELTDSELGLIPKGWEWKSLDTIGNYQNGLALQKYRPEDKNVFLPIVKTAQLKAGEATSKEKASRNINPACIINNGDIVFSWSGSLMVDIWCGGKATLNQHLFKVTSEDYPKWFFYYWTKYHLTKFQHIATDKAVTMGHIKRSHLKEAMCAVPAFGVKKINIMANLIDKQIAARLESTSLTQLRDTLLPKLVSGEISVKATKAPIQEAV